MQAHGTGNRVGAAAFLWGGAVASDTWLWADGDLTQIRALNPAYLTSWERDSPFELACAVLAERARAVEAVAAALLEGQTLTAGRLAELVGTA